MARPYTVMNNRDQIDILYPDHFSAEDNNDGPAEGMYRADQGLDFGWPYCYFDFRQQKMLLSARNMAATARRMRAAPNSHRRSPAFPPHWAPVDVMFYQARQFPAHYQGGAFIAFHGSWNRAPEQRPGAVVFQPFADGKPSGKFEIFAEQLLRHRPGQERRPITPRGQMAWRRRRMVRFTSPTARRVRSGACFIAADARSVFKANARGLPIFLLQGAPAA